MSRLQPLFSTDVNESCGEVTQFLEESKVNDAKMPNLVLCFTPTTLILLYATDCIAPVEKIAT